MEFAEKIKKERMRTGLSRDKFADAIGYSLSAVQKWEDSKRVPKIVTQGAILRLTKRIKSKSPLK
jgi:DNA-binding transcriptional regulator YiaG